MTGDDPEEKGRELHELYFLQPPDPWICPALVLRKILGCQSKTNRQRSQWRKDISGKGCPDQDRPKNRGGSQLCGAGVNYEFQLLLITTERVLRNKLASLYLSICFFLSGAWAF